VSGVSARTAFIYGRPGPHPLNRSFASGLAADFVPLDFLLRWYDVPTGRARKYLSWLLCAALFPRRRSYDVFLSDGIQFLPAIMKRLGLVRRRQKVAALVAGETLFFLHAGRYTGASARAQRWAISQFDALFCLSELQTELARSFVKNGRPLLFTTRGGIASERIPPLLGNRPSLDGRTLIFVGDGPSEWRGWYKGVDVLLETVDRLATTTAGVDLRMLGQWDAAYLDGLFGRFPATRRVTTVSEERLVGPAGPSPHLAAAALYVHLGRGEAFGISVLEAMCAGLPALVSEWTGAREVVARVDPRLVVPAAAARAAQQIEWYFGLSNAERQALSARSREAAAAQTQDAARDGFVDEFRRMLGHFRLPDLSPGPIEAATARG